MEIKSPVQYAEDKAKIAEEFAKLGERLVQIRKVKQVEWKRIRDTVKHNIDADRIWEASELGQEEYEIRMKMKIKEIKMKSLSDLIFTKNTEAKNLY